jgi:hypothetical protein
MCRDIGIQPCEQVIEDQEYQPIFMLLPLGIGSAGPGSPEIIQLASGLQRHSQGDPFPGHEYARWQLSVEPGLAPAWEEQ